jgi:hypothetical protein
MTFHSKKKSKSKYKNIKTVVDGIKFDSKKEANRYSELKMLEKAGIIEELELQPSFIICNRVKWNGRTWGTRKYKADFKYYDNTFKRMTVEDTKGTITPLYSLKRQIFLSLYPQYYFVET